MILIWISTLATRLGFTKRALIAIAVIMTVVGVTIAAIALTKHVIRLEGANAAKDVTIAGQNAVIVAETVNSDAKDQASIQAITDAAQDARRQKEQQDEIAKAAAGAPSAAAVRFGCLRLQRAGHDTSGFPECR